MCDHPTFRVTVTYDPPEPATWGSAGGSPGHRGSWSAGLEDDECIRCGHTLTPDERTTAESEALFHAKEDAVAEREYAREMRRTHGRGAP
jgi:hypothetical protein